MAGFEPATAASSGPMALNINSTPHILAWLPEGAADRLRALRQHSADLNALIPATFDRLAAANAKMEAEQRLARLRGHQSQRGGGFNLPDSDLRVVAARELLDKLTADHARISDLYEIRAAAYASASQTLGAVPDVAARRRKIIRHDVGGSRNAGAEAEQGREPDGRHRTASTACPRATGRLAPHPVVAIPIEPLQAARPRNDRGNVSTRSNRPGLIGGSNS